jgi:NAD+ synthase
MSTRTVFRRCLGLSGGIDSALVAALATDALGPKRVHCVMLPYRYTPTSALSDAAECAKALGCALRHRADRRPVEGFSKALAQMFEGRAPTSPRRTFSPACAARR